MRILANENVPGPLIRELRERGHDVMSVQETMRGADPDPARTLNTWFARRRPGAQRVT